MAVRVVDAAEPGAAWRSRPRRPPENCVDERVGEAEESEREQDRGGRGGPGTSGLEAAGDDQDLADKQR